MVKEEKNLREILNKLRTGIIIFNEKLTEIVFANSMAISTFMSTGEVKEVNDSQ